MSEPELDDWTKSLIADMRAHGGRPSTGWAAGKSFMILTSKGAKSGKDRIAIATYHKDGDRWVIAASKGGAPQHPQWFHNLKAHPDALIEVDNEIVPVRATEATGAERDRLWRAFVDMYPQAEYYTRFTRRTLPLIVLQPEGT